jgi:uncharacterized membrane protein
VSVEARQIPPRATSRLTARTLTIGSLFSALFFLGGVVLDALGRSTGVADLLDPRAIAAAVVDLQAWGWSTIGVIVLIATPAAGLIATALEYRRPEPRSALLAMTVLGVLAVSLAIALMR